MTWSTVAHSWLAVPFADTARRSGLHYALGHMEGPRLVILGDKDDMITMDGIQVGVIVWCPVLTTVQQGGVHTMPITQW